MDFSLSVMRSVVADGGPSVVYGCGDATVHKMRIGWRVTRPGVPVLSIRESRHLSERRARRVASRWNAALALEHAKLQSDPRWAAFLGVTAERDDAEDEHIRDQVATTREERHGR